MNKLYGKFGKILTAAGISLVIAVNSLAIPIEASAARIVTDNVMIRNGASMEAGIIGILNEDDKVTILDVIQSGDEYTWYYVQLENGATGFIRSDLIEAEESELARFRQNAEDESQKPVQQEKLDEEPKQASASQASSEEPAANSDSSEGQSTNYDEIISSVMNDSGSITPPAQDNEANYVTPQMFGAVGNGWTDDTEAIQKALDSDSAVYFPSGEYVISKPIVITNKKFWSMYAQDAIITYTGTGYAVRILNARHSRIDVGLIYATKGGGIEFYSDSAKSWNQYITLTFNCITAKNDCIHIETANDGWSNENQIYGGQFASGKNGVHVRSTGINDTDGWKFYNCGIEGVRNGFLFDAEQGEFICNMVIANARYGETESFDTVLKTAGLVTDCLWIAPSPVNANMFDCSSETTRFEVIAPIGGYWRLPDRAWHRGCIINGTLMAEKTEYEAVK